MIELDPGTLVGKGLHRECYVHPNNPEQCVKIVVAGTSNENHREAKYYRLLARRGISWEMLARFHGLVATNLGEGAIFDLVRDHDGQVSRTLAHYLASGEPPVSEGENLARMLADLKTYLLRNRVITMTLKSKNVLFQRISASAGKLVIIDNVGNSDFIPLANYSAGLARLKIQRKWRRFEQSLTIQQNPDN